MSNFKYTPPKNASVSDEELISDLKQIASKNSTNVLLQSFYAEHGKYSVTTIKRRFGTWSNALLRVGLKPGCVNNYSDEELFENILNVWQHKGRQPVRRDLDLEPSNISQSPYTRRFKSWSYAMQSFVKYANLEDKEFIASENSSKGATRKTSRSINLRLRYKVLHRDNFKCVGCGRSPATDPKIKLHIDHKKPYSKKGETELSNLQTYCSDCNYGKSNLFEV